MLRLKNSCFLFLLLGLSLQELWAKPAIEHAAYTNQELLGEETAPASFVAVSEKHSHRRHRRHGLFGLFMGRNHHHDHHDGCGRHDHHEPHGHYPGFGPIGPDFEQPIPHGHWPHHGYGPPPPPYELGPHISDGMHKTPLAPFPDNNEGESKAPRPSTKPVKATTASTPAIIPTVAVTTTPPSTTEDATLGIDIRIGN